MAIIWELSVGDLFRINTDWYRLRKFNKDNGVLDVVGASTTTELPLDTEITELSVLSKK